MNREERREIIREKVGRFAELARSKNYRMETIKSACIVAGSSQMHENYGDLPEALDKCLEFCEKYDDPMQMMEELLKLAGETFD